MPSFMKDELKKKDEQKLDEMQQEINEAEAVNTDETATEASSENQEEANDEASKNADTAENEVDLQAELEKLTAEVKEKSDKALRLQADFENFRRRTSKEKDELAAVVTQGVMKDMLPLLDNFERAMAAETTDMEAFQKGVEMI